MSEGIIQVFKNLLKPDVSVLKIKLTSEIRLKEALIKAGIEDPATVDKIIITGTMTRADFKFIRKKMSNTLHEIDISKVSIEENRIPSKAFDRCTALSSVAFPKNVTVIRKKAFAYCRSLTSITIPSSVVEIGELAFYGCTGLTYVTIPDSVVEICFRAFADCSALTSVTIPKSVAKIESAAFGNCTALTSVDIPDSDIEIGNYVFANCTSLKSFVIPKKVVKIGEGVFTECKPEITVHPDNPVFTVVEGNLEKK